MPTLRCGCGQVLLKWKENRGSRGSPWSVLLREKERNCRPQACLFSSARSRGRNGLAPRLIAMSVVLFFPVLTTFATGRDRSEEHTSELQSQSNLVCRLLLEKKK